MNPVRGFSINPVRDSRSKSSKTKLGDSINPVPEISNEVNGSKLSSPDTKCRDKIHEHGASNGVNRWFLILALIFLLGCGSVGRLSSDEERRLAQDLSFMIKGTLSKIRAEHDFVWPIKGTILSNLGVNGITIQAYEGQEVKTVKSGLVSFASEALQGYGQTIIIEHADGFSSFYGYNSEILVEPGDVVKQGQVIARAGRTGRATWPQLHFMLFKGQKPVRPLDYLPRQSQK